MISLRYALSALAPMALCFSPAAHAAVVLFTGSASGTDPLGGVYAAGPTGGGLVQFEETAGLQPDPTQQVLFNPAGALTDATSFTLTITGSSATLLPLSAGFGNFFETFYPDSSIKSVWNATENAAGTSITYSAASAADVLQAGERFGTVTTFAVANTLPADFAYTITWSDGPVSPAPEPAAWALMIVGFGVIGAAMRRSSQFHLTYA